MAVDSIISPQEATALNELLIAATVEEYEQMAKPTWKQLQKSARDFLFGYEKLELLRTQNNKTMINAILQDTATKETPAFSLKQLHDKAFYTRAEYALAFKFDDYLTAYRGQAPKTAVYVHYDSHGQQLSSYELPLTKLALMANEEGRLRFSPAQLKNEGAKRLEDSEGEFPNQEHLTEVQAAYMGTKARLMQYYFKSGQEWWHRKNGLVMWKESRRWAIARVTSFGDMKEAYVAALLTNHENKIDALYRHEIGAPSYYDHDLIRIFFEHFIQKVTNKAAIVEEDIVTPDKQYAVKSTGASLPSIQQYLQVAQFVATNAFEISVPELEAEIMRLYPMDAERNRVIATVNKLSDLQTDQLVNGLTSLQGQNALHSIYTRRTNR